MKSCFESVGDGGGLEPVITYFSTYKEKFLSDLFFFFQGDRLFLKKV